MNDDLAILCRLRALTSQITPDAPPAIRWLRAELQTLLDTPRLRRLARDALLRELATHYQSTRELSDALRYYGRRVWPRESQLASRPDDTEQHRLLWQIYSIGIDIPMSLTRLDKLLNATTA